MLGEPPADARHERAQFVNRLFAGPWTTDDVKAQEGYARDRFRWLLGSKAPPATRPGIGRKLERLAWQLHHCFALLQEQSTVVGCADA